jgi:hypothetical protein
MSDAMRAPCHARKDNGDVEAAAIALGVPLTVLHVAVQRAAASVARIAAPRRARPASAIGRAS